VSSNTPSNKPRTIWLACAILLLAFALRVFYLNDRGVWYDEAFAILFASRSFGEMLSGTLTPIGGAAADVHPLFYYFSLHAWLGLVGSSLFSARFYSVVYGVASIPLVYRLARELFGPRHAMITVAVISLAPFHLAYSQEARMYAQLGFWSALAFLAFTRYRRDASWKWWVTFVLAGAAALYSHNLAFVALGALGLWVLIEAISRRTGLTWVSTILAGLAMIALWLPWLINVPGQFGKIEQAYWVPQPTIATFIQTLTVFAFDFENAAYPQSILSVLIFVALALPAFIALGIYRSRSKSIQMYAVSMAVLPIILLLLLSIYRPVYIIRALMPSFLWYVILVGWLLAGLPSLVSRAITVVLVAILIWILPAYYTYSEFPRSSFKEAAVALDGLVESNDAVVHDNKLSFFPMYYHDRGLSQAFIADPSGVGSDTLALPTQRALGIFASSLSEATANRSRVWFIIFREALDQAEHEGHSHPNKAWMDDHFTLVSLTQYNDLNVYFYKK
jgi:4-amino-4-deoxy-L-arabinose transferase-like glycosyltransferase